MARAPERSESDPSPATLSRRLLEGVRREESVDPIRRRLADLSERKLTPLRENRRVALAFWLNVYNAATQLLLADQPELFGRRRRFFTTTAITVAGVDMCLDDIEHGILRGQRSKYGLGYLPRLARCGWSREYRLTPDPRIHFALNCGAESCPAILAYEPDTVDDVLTDATAAALDRSVTYDADANSVHLPRVCLWFIGDFGGPSGLRSFLYEYEQVPPGSKPSLRFEGYDWTRAPRRFADDLGRPPK